MGNFQDEIDKELKRGSEEGTVFGIIFAIIFIAFIILYFMIIIVAGLGAIIGGYYSIKNYILAFKHNVIDSNRKPKVA